MDAPAIEELVVHAHLPQAREVCLVAPFNRWSTCATPMVKRGEALWEVRLPPGTVLEPYCFYVREPGDRWGHIEPP